MFGQEAVEVAGCTWSEAASINNAIGKLAEQRVAELNLNDQALARSKLAWKLAVLRQSLTHRLVDLAVSTCQEWCRGNALSSIVLARSTFETCALVEYVAVRLAEPVEMENLQAINDLLMAQTFATKVKSWLESGDFPQATNILTAVSKLDKVMPGASAHYDRLSDIAHPNSQGTHQFYAITDKATATVTFSRDKRSKEQAFIVITAALGPVAWARRRLEELDDRVQQISEIQHRLTPVM